MWKRKPWQLKPCRGAKYSLILDDAFGEETVKNFFILICLLRFPSSPSPCPQLLAGWLLSQVCSDSSPRNHRHWWILESQSRPTSRAGNKSLGSHSCGKRNWGSRSREAHPGFLLIGCRKYSLGRKRQKGLGEITFLSSSAWQLPLVCNFQNETCMGPDVLRNYDFCSHFFFFSPGGKLCLLQQRKNSVGAASWSGGAAAREGYSCVISDYCSFAHTCLTIWPFWPGIEAPVYTIGRIKWYFGRAFLRLHHYGCHAGFKSECYFTETIAC